MSAMTAGVIRPPMLRCTRASPSLTPRIWAGSTRQSMQVTMYRFRFGMKGSRGMPWRAPGSAAKARLRSSSGAMFDKALPSMDAGPPDPQRAPTACGCVMHRLELRVIDALTTCSGAGPGGGQWQDCLMSSGFCLVGAWWLALVGGPVGGGGGAGVAGQVHSQVGRGAQAAARCDGLDGQVSGFQQSPGLADPSCGQPPQGRHAGLRGEVPREGAWR